MKMFLNEAKEEYIFITNQAQNMEYQMKEQDKVLAEKIERIYDLEEQLHQANEFSAHQTKIIENLEEELDAVSKKLSTNEEKFQEIFKPLLANSDNTKNSVVSDFYTPRK